MTFEGFFVNMWEYFYLGRLDKQDVEISKIQTLLENQGITVPTSSVEEYDGAQDEDEGLEDDDDDASLTF
ncbi:hypothetical protein Q3G72_011653 [Acer saccharum]|nr:hypothetical protein Q3G72_011653 [Acer saccharum]